MLIDGVTPSHPVNKLNTGAIQSSAQVYVPAENVAPES